MDQKLRIRNMFYYRHLKSIELRVISIFNVPGVQGVVTEPVAVAPLANELFDDTDVADETDPDEELLSPF